MNKKQVEDLAKYGSIPIINALTDFAHPCQVLADPMTIRERKGALEGLKACYIGDSNNMMHSIIVGCLKMGMSISVACRKVTVPIKKCWVASQYEGFEMTDSPATAAKDADVLFTDVWASMGQEGEAAERRKAFEGYQINAELMKLAKPDAMVQHCLPAHRGEEITADVFESHADEIFDEAENRLHAQKAVLVTLMK